MSQGGYCRRRTSRFVAAEVGRTGRNARPRRHPWPVVRDSTGQTIIGAQVTMPGTSLIAETDDSGRFELAKVRPGMLSLRFRRLGYQPDTVDTPGAGGKDDPARHDAVATHRFTHAGCRHAVALN